MVDILKGGGRAPPTLSRVGWFFHYDGMYAIKWTLPLCEYSVIQTLTTSQLDSTVVLINGMRTCNCCLEHLERIKHENKKYRTIVWQPLQSATPPHWETSPMAVWAIPGSTRRRIARRLPNRIQIVFGRAAVFYSTIGMGWQKMHKAVEAWKQKKVHINNMHTLHIFI